MGSLQGDETLVCNLKVEIVTILTDTEIRRMAYRNHTEWSQMKHQ